MSAIQLENAAAVLLDGGRIKGRLISTMSRSKVSITLSEELLERIDREAQRRPGGSRSAVIEEWARRGARLQGADLLREETIAYYSSLTPEDCAEDDAIARASGDAARGLNYDE